MSSIALSESFLINSTMPCSTVSYMFPPFVNHFSARTYRGHNWLALFVSDIAEGHLCALVLAELELRVVDVGDLVDGGWEMSVTIPQRKRSVSQKLKSNNEEDKELKARKSYDEEAV